MAPWWKSSPAQKARRAAGVLWTTPLIMLFPLAIGAVVYPSILADYWGVYLGFFGLPFAAAAVLYVLAKRLDSTPPGQA